MRPGSHSDLVHWRPHAYDDYVSLRWGWGSRSCFPHSQKERRLRGLTWIPMADLAKSVWCKTLLVIQVQGLWVPGTAGVKPRQRLQPSYCTRLCSAHMDYLHPHLHHPSSGECVKMPACDLEGRIPTPAMAMNADHELLGTRLQVGRKGKRFKRKGPRAVMF